VSAKAIIEGTLARYGLSALAKWAWDRHLAGDSIEEIMLEMRTTSTYKARFPAMEELSKSGRALSEEEYMQYESTIRELVSAHGLPMNIYGERAYIAELLLNDVSPAEAQGRMQLAESASLTAPAEFREEAARLYGIGPSQWASIWLETDRTLPELERMYAASAIAGEATIADLGELSRQMAERIAGAGITPDQARQGLANVSRELAARLPGEAESALGADTVAAGALGVGAATAALRRRRRQRIAEFAGGGGFAANTRGTSVGTSNR
jgi:hypothetical protein